MDCWKWQTFFRVDIPYRSREEFVEYMSSKPKIVL